MIKRFTGIAFLSFILTGCLTTGNTPKAVKRSAPPAPEFDLLFKGDEPRDWSGSIVGRKFDLNSLSIAQSRFVHWKIEGSNDHLILKAPNGGLTVAIEENACVADATHYDYRVTISLGGESFSGCAINQGGALEVPEVEEDEAIEAQAIKSDDLESTEDKDENGESPTEDPAALTIADITGGGLPAISASSEKAYREKSGHRASDGKGQASTKRSSEVSGSKGRGASNTALEYQIPKDATLLNITFSGENPHWSGSLNGRAFQFSSQSEQVFENRRLSWQGSNQGGEGIIRSPDGSIQINIKGATCSGGQQVTIRLSGKQFNGCAVIH